MLSVVSLALDGERMCELLAQLVGFRSTFVVGLVERHEGFVFNTAVSIRSGVILSAYRKTHLHRKEQAFDVGGGYRVFDVGAWKLGSNICYDANFPEAAAAIASQGARLICYPLNNMMPPGAADRWRSRSVENLSCRAAETGCWVASSDVVGAHGAMVCHGCTCIVRPDGQVVTRVQEGCEGVALFDCG